MSVIRVEEASLTTGWAAHMRIARSMPSGLVMWEHLQSGLWGMMAL